MPNLLKPTNNLMSNLMVHSSARIQPVVGLGATVCHYTDRDACTITKVWEEKGVKFLEVQEDDAKRTDNYGMSDCQDYDYTPNLNGRTYTYRFNEEKNKWEGTRKSQKSTRWIKSDEPGLIVGRRDKYYDFSF